MSTDNHKDADMLRVETLDKKYTVILTASGHLHAHRHGQPWRECVGDNLILTLAQDCETLAERNRTLERELAEANAERDDAHTKLGSVLFKLPHDILCGDVRKWYEEHKTERDQLRAEVEQDKAQHAETVRLLGEALSYVADAALNQFTPDTKDLRDQIRAHLAAIKENKS